MNKQEKDKCRQAYKEAFEARYSSAEALKINVERVAFNTLIEALKPTIVERGRIDVRFDDVRNIYYFPAASGKTLKELFKCILYKAAKTREKFPRAGGVRDFYKTFSILAPRDLTSELIARYVFQPYLEDGFEKTAAVTSLCLADVLDELGDLYHKTGTLSIRVGDETIEFDRDPEEEFGMTRKEKQMKPERKDGPGRKPRTEAARGVYFNLSVACLERLERLAKDFGTSRTKIVELAVEKIDKPRPETDAEKIAEIRRILE